MLIRSRSVRGVHDGPHLLITGGVHGDEFEPMAALRRLITRLDPPDMRGRLTLVPVANEAAYLRGERTAEDGLDLARTCPGDPEGSVTQRTAHALSELIRNADYYIDLHSGGTVMSVLPLVGYMCVSQSDVRSSQRRMAEAFNLPLIWGTDSRLQGRTLSVARDSGIPAIYTEYCGSGRCDPAGVEAYVEGCLNVMGELGMLDRERPASHVERVVKDVRESAGHLQIRNPAPVTGFFEPQVKLGDRIRAGQPLGTIADVLGENVISVPSDETGLVIVLRTFSRIRQGDPVAVVLEEP